ncbi:hypothetical protein HN011_005010, partial [Eciton burchellii]
MLADSRIQASSEAVLSRPKNQAKIIKISGKIDTDKSRSWEPTSAGDSDSDLEARQATSIDEQTIENSHREKPSKDPASFAISLDIADLERCKHSILQRRLRCGLSTRMIDISPKSPRLANRAILPSTQHSFRWNSQLEFDSSPPTLSPHLLFLSVSALAYRDEEAARDASDGAGRREESSRPATSDKAKARGKRGYTDIRAYTDTFIPASIAALASVDSFLVLTCATRDRAASCISPA